MHSRTDPEEPTSRSLLGERPLCPTQARISLRRCAIAYGREIFNERFYCTNRGQIPRYSPFCEVCPDNLDIMDASFQYPVSNRLQATSGLLSKEATNELAGQPFDLINMQQTLIKSIVIENEIGPRPGCYLLAALVDSRINVQEAQFSTSEAGNLTKVACTTKVVFGKLHLERHKTLV